MLRDLRRRLAAASFAAVLLVACGGGGGGGGSDEPPPASSTPSATVTVAPSGGSVSLESKVVAQFSPGVLVAPGEVTASLVPSTDSRAVSARELRLRIPSDLLSTQPDARITLTLSADAATAQAGKPGDGRARAQAIDPAKVWARIALGPDRTASMVLPVIYDFATEMYTAVISGTQWTAAILRGSAAQFNAGNAAVVLGTIDLSAWLWREAMEVAGDDANVRRQIYWWTDRAAPQASPLEGPAPIRPGRLPLLLVHGIDGIPFRACGGSHLYRDTWTAFAQRFFDDPQFEQLRRKYDLYTFAYPTTQSINENGRQLAREISDHFRDRPIVVLAHSMGGLVARFADSYYSKKGLRERGQDGASGYDIDLHGVITLTTPHRGVHLSDDLAWLTHFWCEDSAQGSLDLGWDSDALDALNGAERRPEDLKHLKRYIAYGGSFDLEISVAEALSIRGSVVTPRFVETLLSACKSAQTTHYLYCVPRAIQLLAPGRPEGDGVTLVKSQLLQEPDGGTSVTPAGRFAKGPEFFNDTDHTQIHEKQEILERIRDDLLWIQSPPTATPTNGSFAGNTNIAVSAFAERIYCTLRTTLDGSEPAEPPEPTEASNDPCGPSSPNHITGSSGHFVLIAPASGGKRVKVRFRAWNNSRFGATSSSYQYEVGAAGATVPGVPVATPPNGSFPGNTNISVVASNAERIYCTLRTTVDGSAPAEPPEPTEASNDPCGLSSPNYIAGASGNFVLVAPPTGSKRVKVRFRGWNGGQFGATSSSHDYQVGSAVIEHGDTPATATPVVFGSASAGALELPGDVDYFRFTVTTRATYAFFSTGSTNTRGTLYNGAQGFIASNDSSGEDDNFRFTATLDPGTYYLAVQGSFDTVTGSYSLHVEGPGAGTASDDHGASPWSATPVAIGSATAGALGLTGDVDYFRFTVTARATYAFFTTGSTNTRGTLYNGSYGYIVADDSNGEVDNFRFTATLDPGTYYIAVEGSFRTVTGSYSLHVEGPGAGTTSDDHGASPWSATPVAIGSVTAGALGLTGDVDYFKFTVTARATYAFFTSGATNTRGTLYNDSYGYIVADDSNGEVENFRLTATLDPGTYYIAVEGSFRTVTGSYSLHVEGPGAGTATDDHGASPWSATPIAVGSATAGVLGLTGDVDYFRFTVPARGAYAFFTTGSTNTRGTLYNDSYAFLNSGDSGGEDDNFRLTATLDPGTYYIAVQGSFRTVTGSYTLRIEQQ